MAILLNFVLNKKIGCQIEQDTHTHTNREIEKIPVPQEM